MMVVKARVVYSRGFPTAGGRWSKATNFCKSATEEIPDPTDNEVKVVKVLTVR